MLWKCLRRMKDCKNLSESGSTSYFAEKAVLKPTNLNKLAFYHHYILGSLKQTS